MVQSNLTTTLTAGVHYLFLDTFAAAQVPVRGFHDHVDGDSVERAQLARKSALSPSSPADWERGSLDSPGVERDQPTLRSQPAVRGEG